MRKILIFESELREYIKMPIKGKNIRSLSRPYILSENRHHQLTKSRDNPLRACEYCDKMALTRAPSLSICATPGAFGMCIAIFEMLKIQSSLHNDNTIWSETATIFLDVLQLGNFYTGKNFLRLACMTLLQTNSFECVRKSYSWSKLVFNWLIRIKGEKLFVSQSSRHVMCDVIVECEIALRDWHAGKIKAELSGII